MAMSLGIAVRSRKAKIEDDERKEKERKEELRRKATAGIKSAKLGALAIHFKKEEEEE